MKQYPHTWRRVAACLGLAHSLPTVTFAAPGRGGQPAVRALNGPGLKKAIAGYRGKVVLLNLWATWCGPCVEEFPSLVRLYNKYRSRGLVVLAASVDEPQTQGKVKPFLASQKAIFPAFIRQSGDVDAFISVIDPAWSGAVPTTYLFDRTGKPVGKPLIGEQSYAKFTATVEPLLK
jgi:thiol-disulfide isomerase/thioredoxin